MDCISEVDDVTKKTGNIPGEQILIKEKSVPNSNTENLDSTTGKKLNHKQWKRYLKKMRRKVARQNIARKRDLEEKEEEKRKAGDEYYKVQSEIEAKLKEQAEKDEEINREKQHNEWLLREKLALSNVRVRARPEKQWNVGENINGTETKEDKKAKESTKKELLKNEIMKLGEQQQVLGIRTYHNPENPQNLYRHFVVDSKHTSETKHISGSKTELPSYEAMCNDPSNCSFFLKTGACRYGPRCSRKHIRCENSSTILIPNFFQNASLEIPMLNEKSNDSAIEYDENEMISEFEAFYDDVIGEFQTAGNVVMFKCCQNYVPHLRGNVYVQFSKPEYAMKAFGMFNGRFYAGRQLSVQLSPVTNWKSSICGFFLKDSCPRGKACNFLHVFRNPGNAYSNIDICNSSQRSNFNNDKDQKNSNTSNPDRKSLNNYKDEKNPLQSRLRRDYNRGRRRHFVTRSQCSHSRSRSRSRSPRRRRRRARSRSRSRDRSRR